MNCFISKNYRRTDSAGDKAKTDIEAIMLANGFTNIGLQQRRVKNAAAAYFITLASVMKGVMSLRKGDTLVVQYPLKKYYDFVVKRARARGANVITIIHDLGSFRRKKLTVAAEVGRLNRSSVIVVHSPAMRKWLSDNGVTVPMIELGLFDYRSESQSSKGTAPAQRPRLLFAGNISPRHNEWIYRLAEAQPMVDLILYGGGTDETRKTDSMKEMGYVDSDTIIATADADYGLVWYGDSLDGGEGALGEYLRYNAPHKTSLYLRAGIPVIVWDQSGIADIVKKLDIGLCVPSLSNINDVIASVSPERYAAMRDNATRVAHRLANGSFVTEALRHALNQALIYSTNPIKI